MGDDKLEGLLKQYSTIPLPKKIIGIFDRDTNKAQKYGKTEFTQIENNVYCLCIPVPSHREYHNGICIEFLYKDEDLCKKDSNGRRIFLSSEFYEETGRYKEDKTIGLKKC